MRNKYLNKNEYLASGFMQKNKLSRELNELIPEHTPLRGYWNTVASMYTNGNMGTYQYNANMEHMKTAIEGTWN